jgi:hypothetical protein
MADMSAYHIVSVHFPTALWMASSLLIFLRALSDGSLGHAADRALPVFLVLGLIFGLLAYVIGLLVWPWETLASTPMGRNHMLTATWSLAFFALLAFLRLKHGPAVWQGLIRWVMLVLSGVGVVLVGVTGTLGGHLLGNYTDLSRLLLQLGWDVYTTYYVPTSTLAVLAGISIVLVVLGLAGRRSASAG